VEADGHGRGEQYPRDGLRRRTGRVEDDEVAGIACPVVHDREEPTLVLARRGARGDEDGLAGGRAGAELVHLDRAAREVILREPRGIEPPRDRRQLLLPVVLPHGMMLPEVSRGILPEGRAASEPLIDRS